MITASTDKYRARFRRVLDYIDAKLSEDLTIEELSAVATLSKYHFHRQFTALYGVGVYRYIQLCRLKRASYQLAFRDHSVIDVALINGYEGSESFARAFKARTGQTPTGFRKEPKWKPWYETFHPLNELRFNHMKPVKKFNEVSIVEFKETKVAVLEHRGDPHLKEGSIRNFIEWRKENALPPKVSATFNIFYNHPDEVTPDEYRFDLCAATDMELTENPFGIVSKKIPGGRCAKLRFIGSDEQLDDAISYLYSEWLPQSGEELRDYPLYIQRVKFFPDVVETEAVVDIFLPLK